MEEYNFVRKTLDTLFKVVEVEFKVPLLGFGEIKLPVTEHVKEWWENKKRDDDLKAAIRRAEESFIAAHPDNRLAQILHDFPLYSDEEYQKVIFGLLTHLEEDNITWLAGVKLENEWNKLITKEEIRKAIELYIPFLRHELNGIKEFRDIIAARMLERIDKRTERIEQKLDKVLLSKSDDIPANEPDYWNLKHPYPMPPNFTGRLAERAMLTHWLDDDSENRLFILRALGGFGKSALTWHWLTHDVNPNIWKKVVFWSFYEGDASFEHFVEETLKYLNRAVPQNKREQVEELLKAMQPQKILLIIDGFERVLRAYSSMNAAYQGDEDPKIKDNQLDCVNINAEWFLKGVCAQPNIKSKVLMTTRLTPRIVKPRREFMLGCCEEELIAMQKEDAVEFFRKQKIKGTSAEIEKACALYGYHPLSLRLLAGAISEDRGSPKDIIASRKFDLTDDIIQNKRHILDHCYNSLTQDARLLISLIACFRGSVHYTTLNGFENYYSDTLSLNLDSNLKVLETIGLLQWDKAHNIYDMHPIVRRYSYGKIKKNKKVDLHHKLYIYFHEEDEDYFIKDDINKLQPYINQYYHLVLSDHLDEAWQYYRDELLNPILYDLCLFETQVELLEALCLNRTDNKIPRLKNKMQRGIVMNELANTYSRIGLPRHAISLYKDYASVSSKQNDTLGNAIALANLGLMQLEIGQLRGSFMNTTRSLDLCKRAKSEEDVGIALQNLGLVNLYLGDWEKSNSNFDEAFQIFERFGMRQSLSVVMAYKSESIALQKRFDTESRLKGSLNLDIKYAEQSLHFAEEDSGKTDFARAYWMLGVGNYNNGDLGKAEDNLLETINICRQINWIETEASMLLALAHVRYNQKKYKDAKSLSYEAMLITERYGYVLQGADANLFFAQYALEQEKDKVKAKVYAEEAKKLATCDGPPYYYKVAYDEAERFLEKLAG